MKRYAGTAVTLLLSGVLAHQSVASGSITARCADHVRIAENALIAAEQRDGTNSSTLFAPLLALGDACSLVDQNEAAKRHFARALKLALQDLKAIRNDLKPRIEKVSTAQSRLGFELLQENNFEGAEQWFTKALQSASLALPDDSDVTKIARNGKALAMAFRYQYDQRVTFLQALIQSDGKAFGPQHRETARALDALSTLYMEFNHPDLALPLSQRALAIYRKALPPDHPHLADALNRLASIHYVMKANDKALPLLEEALTIRNAAFGPHHAKTELSRKNLEELRKATPSTPQRNPPPNPA